MLLHMLYLILLGALMPLTSIAYPTSSNVASTSNTLLDQLLGRDQAPHERTAKSIANVTRAGKVMIPTSVDPTDNTPIYTFRNNNMPQTNIFGNLTTPAANGFGGSGGMNDIINFKWGIGPVILSGRIDTDTLDTDVTIWIYGLKLGEFQGNLISGITIDINLRLVKGEIKVYLKNKNEVWLHLSLVFSFGKKLETEVKILTLPDIEMLKSLPQGGAVQGKPQRLTASATDGGAATA